MSIIASEQWKPLVNDATGLAIENLVMSTAEIITQPVPVGVVDRNLGHAVDLIELRAFLSGAKVGGTDDLTLNLYRCPDPDKTNREDLTASQRLAAYLRSSEPFATQAADVSDETVLGSDLVTTGDFASDATWLKGNGWTITGGEGVHSTTSGKGEISQPVTMVQDAEFLLTFDLPNFDLDAVLDVWIGRGSAAQHITTISFTGYLASGNARTFQWLGTGAAHDLRFVATQTGSGLAIDNVVLKRSYPYRLHNVQKVDTVGSALVYGFAPAADYAATYLSAYTKRYRLD